jgi:apolipoprotein D and lipocalin family protein
MKKILLPIILLLLATACSSQMKTLKTVPDVDLQKYSGKWYEIARLPNSFEKGLTCVTAEYTIRDDGKVTVLNSGRKESDLSKISTAKGKAWVPDPNEPGRLKVSFFWPFAGGYYIFHLDSENYQYALVGDPSRKYFWILARSPFMADELYAELMDIARQNGFAVEQVLKVKQDCWR